MRTLSEIGVFSGSVAEEMAQGARFRNVLSTLTGTSSITMVTTRSRSRRSSVEADNLRLKHASSFPMGAQGLIVGYRDQDMD